MLSNGYDLPTKQSILTWSGYYNNPKTAEKLKKVEILKDELNSLKEILQSDQILDDADIMITNSHVWICDFIHRVYQTNTKYTVLMLTFIMISRMVHPLLIVEIGYTI